MSRCPAVVSMPTRAPLPSSNAFVATVVPCTMRTVVASSAGSDSPNCTAASRSPSSTPSDWSAGVVSALATVAVPSGAHTTTSVKVPPTSTPMA